MERSIQEVARAAGTTARTLRHYDALGLVPAARGANGYRTYDDRALLRLQRVLLLRELGLGLDAIGRVLEAQQGAETAPAAAVEAEALTAHLELLRGERARITAQMGAVERTIAALQDRAAGTDEENGDLMDQDMFAGFDHTAHREEVERRWGAEAYAAGDRWWRGRTPEERRDWQERVAALNAAWAAAAERGDDPASAPAQELARQHVAWLRSVPGTPAADPGADLEGYLRGLGELYVADERFAANYGGAAGAAFVRDALAAYARGGEARGGDA